MKRIENTGDGRIFLDIVLFVMAGNRGARKCENQSKLISGHLHH